MQVMRKVVLFSIVAFTTVGLLWGQGLTGTISGIVKDPNGAVVPNADVTATNAGTNAQNTAKTDGVGYYRIINLVPGHYVVSVQAAGFRRAEVAPQLLTVAGNLRIDFTLELGQVTETVTVETSATQVNTEDAQMGQSLVNIPALPNISGGAGRNPLNLVTLQPGVISTSGASSTTVGPFSVNGQRAQANNDLAINVPDSVQQISPNALQEFRVVTGAMKAEYGRNTGAIVEVVTKSGTNSFHGGAQEIFRNTKLNATPFFLNSVQGGTKDLLPSGDPRRQQWNTNDYDAQLQGPIIRDRLFFALSYLGFKRRQAQTTRAFVPTDAERQAILAYGTPAAKAVMNLIPAANSGADTYQAALGNKLDRDQGIVRIDFRINNSNTLSGTYFIESQRRFEPIAFQGSPLPGFGELDLTRFQNVILRDTHTFSPTILNDFRFSFHRRGSPAVTPVNTTSPAELGFTGIIPDDPGGVGPPYFDFSGAGLSAVGNTYQGPQTRYDNTYQMADSVSWIRGRHSFKFGGDVKTYQQNQLFDFVNNGYFYWDGAGTELGFVENIIPGLSAPLNDFANGFSTEFYQANSGRQGYRDKFVSWYVQDDWKVRPNLTLNLGLRWEYTMPLYEVHNEVVAFREGQVTSVYHQLQPEGATHTIQPPIGMLYYGDPGITRSTYQNDLNNFGPRFGLAWDPTGNGLWSVRAGFGVFYDSPISELTLQFLGNPPLGLSADIYYSTDMTNPYPTSQYNPIPQPFPFHPVQPGGTYDYTTVAPIGLTVMDPYFRNPYSMQWNIQVQRQLFNDWLIDVGYVGSSGVKLLNRFQLNPGVVTPSANSGNTNLRRRLTLANPEQSADYGVAALAGITDQLTNGNSIYNSLQINVHKRLSHGLTMNHAYTWAHSIDNSSSLRINSIGNIYNRAFDRGNSDTDVRHRYVGSIVYDLPFFKSGVGITHRVLGGWSLSSVISAQTGIPFNITEPQDRSLTGAGADRPDYIGGTIQLVDPRDSAFGRLNSYFDGTGGGTSTAASNPYFRRVGSSASYSAGAGRYGNFGRNVLHGPGLVNFDLSIAKEFSITESQKITFRAESFNLFNHTNFLNPNGSIGSSSFGRITTARDPRLTQLTLKYSF
jgi:hypothetical protein